MLIIRLARHSDISLVELGNEPVKEDERAILLEGAGLQSSSPKARSSSFTSHIVKFVKCAIFFLIFREESLLANIIFLCPFSSQILSNGRVFLA